MGIIKSKIPTWQRVCAGFARLQPWYLLTKYQNRWAKALFAFVNACISIGIISVAAVVAEQPLIFPVLGPISFLCFYSPSAGESSPRNVILSHGSGMLIGWLTLVAANSVFGAEGMATQIIAVARDTFDMLLNSFR
jgi:CBS-domain-containing membrane protein